MQIIVHAKQLALSISREIYNRYIFQIYIQLYFPRIVFEFFKTCSMSIGHQIECILLYFPDRGIRKMVDLENNTNPIYIVF